MNEKNTEVARDEQYKIIVAHPFKQHSYRLATALQENNIKCKYITTIYYKKNTLGFFLTGFLRGDKKNRICSKHCKELDDQDVKVYNELLGILMLAVNRLDKKKRYKYKVDRWLERSFGKKVAKYAIKQKADAVIMYDLYAGTAFRYLQKKAPWIKRIIDASAAYVGYMKDLFEKEEKRKDIECDNYRKAYPQYWNPTWCEPVLDEVKYTDYIITASEHSKNSYVWAGVSENKIYKVPYGVDSIKFRPLDRKENELLKIVFVGNFLPRKGLHFLMKALEAVKDPNINTTVIGAIETDSVVYQNYKDNETIRFAGRVDSSEIEKYYQEADVCVLPSLSEGMSLSGLEAMACGVPVICTDNSGVNDLVEDGINGFVVGVGDIAKLIDKILWCCTHREQLQKMRPAARKRVLEYTWENYNGKIGDVMQEILHDANEVGKWVR